MSPDGKRLATVTAAFQKLVVWDAQTGEKVCSFNTQKEFPQHLAWSPDGKRLTSTSWHETVLLWDVQTGDKIRSLNGHSDSVYSLSWSPDGKRLASASVDKSVIIWDAKTGEKIRSLNRQFGEGDVARALAHADDERGARTTFTDVGRETPPFVIFTSPEDRSRVTEGEIRIKAVAKNTGDQPVTSLQLEVNGQPTGNTQRVQEPKKGQVPVEWTRVQLQPGKNTIRVSARAGGSIGHSDPIEVTWDTRQQIKVRLHMLIIGIGKYKHASDEGGYFPLDQASEDAKRFRDAFTRHGKGLYDEIPEPLVLLDTDATREKILDAVQEFGERMNKNDVGIIFYAGHGDRVNERLYLAAYDTLKNKLVRTGISASQLRDTLAGTKGRK